MRLFDVLGPVMTGPSSSHTAGAVRIGLTARNLLGEAPKTAEILLHGSFAATGRGHGTDRALVAGLLGMLPDDERIPDSFSLAQQAGLDYTIGTVVLRQIDGITTNFGGDHNTLIVHNQDTPGHVAEVTTALAQRGINIATMQLYRSTAGGYAVMVLECDQPLPDALIAELRGMQGIVKVTGLNLAQQTETKEGA